jgi:hypothetical protein
MAIAFASGATGDRVRLITRGGHDLTKRFPWIAEAALKNRRSQFVLDGEAVILSINGMSDFNALHSRNRTTKSSSAPSTCWRWTGKICAACPGKAQDEPRSASARPVGRHLREPVRDKRDRVRPLPRCLRHGP